MRLMGAFVEIRLSPSRVEKFLECAARWGYSELEGMPEPGTEATELGTIVHGLRESYYEHGTPFDLSTRGGWLAAAMSPVLPVRLPDGGKTEHEMRYPVTHRGRSFDLVGRLDLCYPGADYAGKRIAVVRDYKTTASMGYAKIEREALLGHSQAPLYGLMWMRALSVPSAWLGWIYVNTRTSLGLPPWPVPDLLPSDHVVTHDDCEERVHLRMVPAAYAMLELRDAFAAGTPVDDFPKNTTACFNYHKRCPHWARCQPEKAKEAMSAFLAAVGTKVAATEPAPPATGAPNSPQSSLFGAPVPPAPTPVETPPAGASQPATGAAPTPPAGDSVPINPPEGAGTPDNKGKGKGKKDAAATFTPEVIDAIATAVVQKLGLMLVRNAELPRG